MGNKPIVIASLATMDLLIEIIFYFQEFQNERQHHLAFSRYVSSDGFTLQNCRRYDSHEGR